jgi:hypothetical protein
VSTVPATSASAGASTSTGSTDGALPADVETAVYRRNCQQASTASASSAKSTPAPVARESTARLPGRAGAAARRGRSSGYRIAPTDSPAIPSAAASASSQVPAAVTLMPPSGTPPPTVPGP